jgi:hypothetical protein
MDPRGGAPARDDAVARLTRWSALVVAPVLVAAGVILSAFPAATDRLWAWPMGPDMTALAVGGGYLAGAVLFVRALREPRWHRIGLVFLAATALTVLLLLATLLHWDRFSHGHVSFWTWLVVYLVTPVLLPVVWLRNRRTDPGTAPPGTPIVPRWLRGLVGAAGALQLAVALAFYARPEWAIRAWPWTLTPLTARTLSAFLAFIAVMWLAFLVEARWSALQLHIESATLGLALVAVGALRAPDDFADRGPAVVVFTVLLGSALGGLIALQVAMRRRSRTTGGPAPAEQVAGSG